MLSFFDYLARQTLIFVPIASAGAFVVGVFLAVVGQWTQAWALSLVVVIGAIQYLVARWWTGRDASEWLRQNPDG